MLFHVVPRLFAALLEVNAVHSSVARIKIDDFSDIMSGKSSTIHFELNSDVIHGVSQCLSPHRLVMAVWFIR